VVVLPQARLVAQEVQGDHVRAGVSLLPWQRLAEVLPGGFVGLEVLPGCPGRRFAVPGRGGEAVLGRFVEPARPLRLPRESHCSLGIEVERLVQADRRVTYCLFEIGAEAGQGAEAVESVLDEHGHSVVGGLVDVYALGALAHTQLLGMTVTIAPSRTTRTTRPLT